MRPITAATHDAIARYPQSAGRWRRSGVLPAASVEAAGNYVEIAWRDRRLLHRATLSAVEATLAPAFVRIHRGRLVRRAAIRTLETERSGDFTVTLASGATLRGSRRYRSDVEQAPPP